MTLINRGFSVSKHIIFKTHDETRSPDVFFPKPLFYISHVYIQPAMFVFVASYSTNEHIDLHEVKQGGGHLGGSVTIAASERPVNVLWAAQEFYKAKAW